MTLRRRGLVGSGAVSLLAITTNGKIGLGLVALVFIAFALVSSFVLPRRNPNFPGRGLGAYLAVATLIFLAMIAAVVVFAKESEEEGDAAEVTETAPGDAEPTGTGTEPTETGETETGGRRRRRAETVNGDGRKRRVTPPPARRSSPPRVAVAVTRSRRRDRRATSARTSTNRSRTRSSWSSASGTARGAMPAFEGQLDDEEIANVIAYVVASTSG